MYIAVLKKLYHYIINKWRLSNALQKTFVCIYIIIVLMAFAFCLPSTLFTSPTSYIIKDKDDNLLSASIASDGQWRFPYNEDVPDKFTACITAFEDNRFRYHPGVDPLALIRALWLNISKHSVISGGSTITMQVIRLSSHHNERNVFNKMIESVQALRLECTYNKKDILALYAANAPFGSNVVGLDAASWRYYGRSANDLSWGETAALAVLPNAPSVIYPGKNHTALLVKRNRLLDKLQSLQIIDSTTTQLAKEEPLPGQPMPLPQLAPHLLDRFKKDVLALKQQDLNTGITTTIDMHLQQQVNNIVMQHHNELVGNQVNNLAAMVVEVETGNILSYVGNVYLPQDSSIQSHVDVLDAKRSPGSTLKPILYASLLTEGKMLPQQLVPDIPTQIQGYAPENFDLGYDGAVPANKALARSLNIPAVKMLQQYRFQRFYNVLNQCGITTLNKSPDYYGMSMILGGCEISPYELAGVYSSMARMYLHQKQNKGKWNSDDWFMPKFSREPSAISYEQKAHGSQLTAHSSLFDYTSLWHTFNAMNEVMRPGEEGLWSYFQSAQRIAWKTGTSFGFRDGWAVGFTPKYCVIVWAGNTTGEGRPGLTGINTAAPVMFDIFRMLPVSKWFAPPQYDFTYLPVCHQSGYKAGSNCTNVDIMMVSTNAQNAPVCPYHHIIHLDGTGTYRVTANCETPSSIINKPWFELPPTIEYYYRQHHAEYKPLPPFKPGCNNLSNNSIDIVYPQQNAIISIPTEINGTKGKAVFTATCRNKEKLFWHLDDEYIGTTEKFHQVSVDPPDGEHTLTVVDEDGESITRKFRSVNQQ